MKKYFITPFMQRFRSMVVTQKQAQEWAAKWKFFFILAHGRSGTNFLANLLNQSQGAYVFHEPVLEDFLAYLNAFHNLANAENYFLQFRKKEIYVRMQNIPSGVYGEVNSVLRSHAEAIKDVFPGATLIHMVRDGRDVVRSTMSRNTFTIKNPYSLGIYPGANNPWRLRWGKMDRFSKICWLWQEENARLREQVKRTVQFEKILSSYEYFFNEILEPCNLFVDKKLWDAAISSPRNITNKFEMPSWEDWPSEQQKIFIEICGEEMALCGYSI